MTFEAATSKWGHDIDSHAVLELSLLSRDLLLLLSCELSAVYSHPPRATLISNIPPAHM
jgi:hypothetical protein